MRLTGVPLLDEVLGGFSPGLPLVLAGPIGSGRTVVCLELARAGLSRGERVVFLTIDPPSVLLRQAVSLGMDLGQSIREGRLALLELLPQAGRGLRTHGARPLLEALRAESPGAELLIVDGLRALFQDLLDAPLIRTAVEVMLAGWNPPHQLVVASVEIELLRQLPPLEVAISDMCGALLELELEPAGTRWLAVRKSRFGSTRSGRVCFELGSGGSRFAGSRAASESSARGDATDPAAPRSARPRVAVIDPDGAVRQQLVRWLSERYDVIEGSDGIEALSAALAAKPDLMVLELMLPRVSGYEVLRACQKTRSPVPILVLSALLTNVADRIRPLLLGAADLMTKPPTRVELLHRVDALLRAPPREATVAEDGVDLLLFAESKVRTLEEGPFRELVTRAFRFGERFEVASTLVAIACASAAERDAFLEATDAALRPEDAVLAVGARRALMLLVDCEAKAVPRVVRRLEERMPGDPALQSCAFPLAGEADRLDLEAAFEPLGVADEDDEKEPA